MPFIKRATAAPPAAAMSATEPADSFAAQIEGLVSPVPDRRWSAARGLGAHAEAVPALAAALANEPLPRVREAIMTALMRIGDAASVLALLPYLRSQDAAQRAAAIEALQSLPEATAPFMAALLRDADSDVRLLATELTRNMSAATATRLLCDLLACEMHPNVCGAAIEVLAEVGNPDAIPTLQACADRFAGTPFVPFAASVAIARIAGSEG